MSSTKTVLIIAGPTASGKTDLSLQLAAHYNTSIISADSRQCYRELNIGVAKPPRSALDSVRHYFINSHSVAEDVNAQVFEEYALGAAREIFAEHDVAIMVGGTGMYIKAFCEGLDEMPAVDPGVRNELRKFYLEKGLTWLQHEVQNADSIFWATAEQKNPHRLMRALEVIKSTGRSITSFRTSKKVQRPFEIIKLGISLPKETLHAHINTRVDDMIKQGFVEEVRSLEAFRHTNALQTLGYKEMFSFVDGLASLPNVINEIKLHTRQYAKRQLTWFRKDPSIKWLDVGFLAKNPVHSIIQELITDKS